MTGKLSTLKVLKQKNWLIKEKEKLNRGKAKPGSKSSLVQSIPLNAEGSAVRTRQLPQKP